MVKDETPPVVNNRSFFASMNYLDLEPTPLPEKLAIARDPPSTVNHGSNKRNKSQEDATKIVPGKDTANEMNSATSRNSNTLPRVEKQQETDSLPLSDCLMQNQLARTEMSSNAPSGSIDTTGQSSPDPSSAISNSAAQEDQQEEADQNEPTTRKGTIATTGPAPHDVVCGRGMFMYYHPGSVRFRNIIRNAIPYYEVADSRSLKAIVIGLVLEQVFEGGNGDVRFLKFDSHTKTWIALGKVQVRDKVGHALRDKLLEINKNQQFPSTRRGVKDTARNMLH